MTVYYWNSPVSASASMTTCWTPNGLPGPTDVCIFEDVVGVGDCSWDLAEVAYVNLGYATGPYNGTVTTATTCTIDGMKIGTTIGAPTFTQNHPVTTSNWWLSCGTWNMNADLLVKDTPPTYYGAHVIFTEAAGTFANNGTATSPRRIQSVSTKPTYPVRLYIREATPDARSLDFTYLEWVGACAFLGNDSNDLWFNTGTADDGLITMATPLQREPKITSHFIEGRAYSRIYWEGAQAGIVNVTGLLSWDSFKWQQISELMADSDPLAFQFDYVTVPRGRIESFRANPKPGSLYVPFSMTIIEDH